jgi:hypothetical protein
VIILLNRKKIGPSQVLNKMIFQRLYLSGASSEDEVIRSVSSEGSRIAIEILREPFRRTALG